jgi:hypothetical protein
VICRRIARAATVVALTFLLTGCLAIAELAEVGAAGELAEAGGLARLGAASELGGATARGVGAAELGGAGRSLGALRGPGIATSLDIGGSSTLPATEAELFSLRNIEPNLRPAAVRGLVLARSLSDVQLNSLLAIDARAFGELRVGQRIYAAIQDGSRAEAGWLRKVDSSTVHFNDGQMDLVRSEISGNFIDHYSLRLGRPTPLARTIIQNSGKRLVYQAWLPETNAYITVGYGDVSPTGLAIDIYSIDNRFLGKLRYSSIGRSTTARLPQPTISNGVLATASTAVLLAQFEPASGGLLNDKCMRTAQSSQGAVYPGAQELLSVGGAQYRLVVMPFQGTYAAASTAPCAPTVEDATEAHYRAWRQLEASISHQPDMLQAPTRSSVTGEIVGKVIRYDDVWDCAIVAITLGKSLKSGQQVSIGLDLKARIARAQGAQACATPDSRPSTDISGSPVFAIQ